MIEKMNFLSITGPKADIDRVVNTYLCKYEIHLENALSELTTVENLTPFLEVNPYRDALNSINAIYEELKSPPAASGESPGIEKALSTVKEIRSQADQLQQEQAELEEKCSSLEESLRIMLMDEAMSDLCAMNYLEDLAGRDVVMKCIEPEGGEKVEFESYPRSIAYLVEMRKRVNREIEKRVK